MVHEFLGMCFSDVEYLYVFIFANSMIVCYFIMMVETYWDVMSIAFHFDLHIFWNYVVLILQLRNSPNASVL